MLNYKKEVIEELCFFRQKIVDVTQKEEEYEYELLLRQNKSGKYIFPEQLFYKIIVDREYHELYITHINDIIYSSMKNSSTIYSLNMDYQELYYPETIEFLKKFKYKKKLKIELTERIPINRNNPYKELVPIKIIEQISDLGYQVVLDDFLSGVNTFETLFSIETLITRVKISVLPFKKSLSLEDLRSFIFSVVKTINFLDKEIVIEGAEDINLLDSFPKSWKQQTYFFDVPHKFLEN